MDTLNLLIQTMSKEEVRYFKLFTSRISASEERKDIQLFDYIRKSTVKYKEEKILNKLYFNQDKNAFYRIKNRLHEELNKCLVSQHFQNDEQLNIYHLLSMSRLCYTKQQYQLTGWYLRKAEKKAVSSENFAFLDLIYNDFIKLSNDLISVDPEKYIQKRKENAYKLERLRELDDVLIAVSYRLKVSQNYGGNQNSVINLLEETIKLYSKEKTIKNSAVFNTKLFNAVSQVLLQKHDYIHLEPYLLKTYNEFLQNKFFLKSNHNLKLQMLTYIINTLFKNKKLNESLAYAETLKNAMQEFNNLLYEKYLFFYYNSLVINYSVLDKQKAIDLLEDLKDNKALKKNSYYEIFIFLNLSIFYFDSGNYRKSLQNLNKLFLHENYQKTDSGLKFKIAMAELLIRFESGNFDVLENKISFLQKHFIDFLIGTENRKELELTGIIKMLITSQNKLQDKVLQQKIKKFISEFPSEEDKEIINYNTWLGGKLK